jgi:pimeloyl-ACP methyl ester carboxylesterase
MQFLIFIATLCSFISTSSTGLPPHPRSISCQNVEVPQLKNAMIISITKTEKRNFTVPQALPFLTQAVPNLSVCEIKVIYTHNGGDDKVVVQTWLPLDDWNGRFVAVGGSAWAAGLGDYGLAPVVAQGYAAASTDAGLSGDPTSPGAWAIKQNGEVNMELLTNFASRSIHELALLGKAVTASYFNSAPEYSYWFGCSTGGRQGLVAAQKYPTDFNGIVAGAPAIYWTEYVIAELWPQVVMHDENLFPSPCEFNAITDAAVLACDTLDGVQDNVVTDLRSCKFDPFTQVGKKINCEGGEVVITKAVASIVRKIWEGLKTTSGKPLWSGLPIDSSLDYLANTTVNNGARTGSPFLIPDTWIRYFVTANPTFNISAVDTVELSKLYFESVAKYRDVIDSASPDLSGLRDSGSKLLVWHGKADQLIFPQGTVKYRKLVEREMGGNSKVDNFFRLFLAPGVDHCGAGTTPGAVPTDPLGSLRAWVENGTAPEVLEAETLPTTKAHFSRSICRYPLISKYRGQGDTSASDSYECQ